MDKQLEGALTGIINKAVSGVDASIAFLSAELPDVVTQLITFNVAAQYVYITLWLVVLVMYAVFIHKITTAEKPEPHEENWVYDRYGSVQEYIYMVTLFATAAPLFASVRIIIEGIELLKLTLAPKIWLIEYAANLAK